MDANELLVYRYSAEDLFKCGVEKSLKGDYKGAIEDFDQALQLNPNSADAYGNRCVARYRLGDRQGAIEDCQKAAALYLEQGKTNDYQYALKTLGKLQQTV